MRVNIYARLYKQSKWEWKFAFLVEIEANEAKYWYLHWTIEQTRVET